MFKPLGGLLIAVASALFLTAATPLKRSHITEFKSSVHDDTGLRFVKDSGICETTPGVSQISGYLDIGANMSMWFWFFEARHTPETAPFTLWINGGPGCSSMIGLFQEHGPCHVNPDGNSTTLNPFSWNNVSNMIYIDQPIGTGFSYGTSPVNSTESAAPFFWTAFQLLFESGEFEKFRSREFVFATESYGGHYGPSFVTYFDEQNEKIDKGELKGEKITTAALMINNGWYDPLLQNKAYVDFATNAPGYGQLVNDSVLEQLNEAFYGENGCKVMEEACYAAGTNSSSNAICISADNFCVENVFIPAIGDRDVDDLRQNSSALFPPEFYVHYLANPDVKAAIGANATYRECSGAVGGQFGRTGDDARTWLPQLGALANSRLKVLIWAGDADINCNWLGGYASVEAMDWYGHDRLVNTPFKNITLDGAPVASIKNIDNFSFARVYQAGHEVPAFQPEAALAIFEQVIKKEQLHSV
ncbi:alpha/beta-hydrolase [Punctularia strigosozonata HHB-11173 SS5]|uniref:alpha/beta-hydrolase n=1 Tax=Punctularia strigosozonata (strain HHB-11173) TaxID=741275 RepID=UPI0004417EF4|nr:alpha/beta-hydrolase [Punctularia strigosozonata HHB-11173 SS5]EIN14710.1 alpha/beta-hydrolase [Punctularia strigosozonata HHB-11173 SS5]